MAQALVTGYYSTRKRFKNVEKEIKNVEQKEISRILTRNEDTQSEVVGLTVKERKLLTQVDTAKKSDGKKQSTKKAKISTARKKNTKESLLKSEQPDIRTALSAQNQKKSGKLKIVKESSEVESVKNCNVHETTDVKESDVPITPKRNLSSPDELTPSKKKALLMGQKESLVKTNSEHRHVDSLTPKKTNEPGVRRKLHLSMQGSDPELNDAESRTQTPQKASDNTKSLVSLIEESRSKILFSDRIDELKKSLEKFQRASAKAKEFQSNSCKITSIVSSGKKSCLGNQSPILTQHEPAYKKYSHLTAPESSSLILPFKYKLLCETFRCMDIVVSMIHNRKEEVTFEKVQKGVQKMMNRNFTKTHLGQVMTVMPSAYSLHYEKCDTIISSNKIEYKLVIKPNLDNTEGSSDISQNISPQHFQKSSKSCPFIYMNPQHLIKRESIFHQNILNLVRKYHQDFLSRLNFPSVSDNNILRWHPKFQVDSVPDVDCATLPEVPETKVCTARDVLNKIRGTVKGRVEKALQSVAEESKVSATENKTEILIKDTNGKKHSSALKGICTDLLERIRARESAKHIESMMRTPQEEKRIAMMERVPKIIHILWHYFIAERKSAVPVDAAIEKIVHSLNTLITPNDVREYLQLITETCPGWLSFTKISKGEYITMDKKKDINLLLSNLK